MNIYDDTYLYLCNLAETPMNTYLFKPAFLCPLEMMLMQSEIGKNIQGRFFDNRPARLNQMEFMSRYIKLELSMSCNDSLVSKP